MAKALERPLAAMCTAVACVIVFLNGTNICAQATPLIAFLSGTDVGAINTEYALAACLCWSRWYFSMAL